MNDSETVTVLQGMMVENTGRSLLDSGDFYGRAWQRNQGIDFTKTSASVLKFYPCPVDSDPEDTTVEIDSCSLNVFHFLEDRLRFSPEMQGRFDRFVETQDPYSSDIHDIEEFVAHLQELDPESKENEQNYSENSYNGESLLSQVIQYRSFVYDGRVYIALQIHGGCDVRGGYTRPKMFEPLEEWYPLADHARGTIRCSGKLADAEPTLPGADWPESQDAIHMWDTENGGYTFTPVYRGEDGPELLDLKQYTYSDIRVDEDGNGYCPVCGGVLSLCAF